MSYWLIPIAILVFSALRVVQQYEKGVVFRLGKVIGERGPGWRIMIPIIDIMRKVSLQIITMPIPSQKIITKDNVSIDVAAVAYFQIVDATKSLVAIQNVVSAVNQISQTTIRNFVGQFTLDEVLSETDKINKKVKNIIDTHTEAWGVSVKTVEIKDIQLPDTMQRAMAKQAEAEREKRAKIIAAEGEFQSADQLGKAADVIAKHPIALQLRNLQVLSEIAVEKNSTIVFPSQLFSSVDNLKKFVGDEISSK
ncbi:MAG: slipin family protein [Patescibacteria group bacterium]|jgi:regulator of protease activity HflC (stomatin/prohibitin superfamily)